MRPPQINQSMSFLQWGVLLALSVLWGGSFFFISLIVRELPPLTMATLRLLLAALFLYGWARATSVSMPKEPGIWARFAVLGVLNSALPFCLYAWAQIHIASGLASILNATTPLFTVLVAHALTRDERMTGGHVVGALIGLAGVVAMIGNEVFSMLNANVAGELACLAGAISYAFAAVYGRRFAGVSPLALATGQLAASGLVLLPVMLVVDQPWNQPIPSNAALAAIVSQALFSTALAYVLFFRLLATAGATNVVLVTFLNPVTAIILGVTFLGERIEPVHLAGMAVIGIGLAFIDGRPFKALTRRA